MVYGAGQHDKGQSGAHTCEADALGDRKFALRNSLKTAGTAGGF